ncbi:MAG TPA: SMI1/KNR4 family protein [Oligoflexia bacterium]|nr:SMI1/KNR4 family protein [Oligoflexia bacterium]HMR24381.1 SMI1/KNR4 family protein [Oligoflexia bacterium]
MKLIELKKIPSSFPDFKFSFSKGASKKDIQYLIELYEKPIPQDLIDILTFSNGFELFNDDNLGGVQFLNVKEIHKINQEQKNIYGEDWINDILIFAYMIGEGNHIGLKLKTKNQYELLDCFHEEAPKSWQKIPGSIQTLLSKLVKNQGKIF